MEKDLNELERLEDIRELDESQRGRNLALQEEFSRVAICSESLARQKSRSKWILEVNHNSKYFHNIANWRRKKIFVKRLSYW